MVNIFSGTSGRSYCARKLQKFLGRPKKSILRSIILCTKIAYSITGCLVYYQISIALCSHCIIVELKDMLSVNQYRYDKTSNGKVTNFKAVLPPELPNQNFFQRESSNEKKAEDITRISKPHQHCISAYQCFRMCTKYLIFFWIILKKILQ